MEYAQIERKIEGHQDDMYNCVRKLRNYVYAVETLCKNYDNTSLLQPDDCELIETISDITQLLVTPRLDMMSDYIGEFVEFSQDLAKFKKDLHNEKRN